jgi:formylmethanofuran--tetrahydromethanopterin N-formyltransferase
VETALPPEVACAYEIVIDGLTLESVEVATAEGIRAGCLPGIVEITAGNYGGKLGPFHVRLRDVMARPVPMPGTV